MKSLEGNGIMKLQQQQSVRFQFLKSEIKKWISDRFKIGEYLSEIQATKLYKEDFDTFEEFCKTEFGIERAHAYRLIEASEIKMSPIGDKIENEAQARELAKADQEERPHIVAAVLERSNGKLTAKGIAAEIEKPKTGFKPARAPEPVEAVELDSVGREIPKAVLADWHRAAAVGGELRSMASKVKCAIQKGTEGGDLVWAELTNSLVTEASAVHYALGQILPHAVCPTCQGKRGKCSLCRGRGFISKFRWDSLVPVETKNIILKKK